MRSDEPTVEEVKKCFTAKLEVSKEYLYFFTYRTQALIVPSGGKIPLTKNVKVRVYMLYGWDGKGDCPCVKKLAEKHESHIFAKHKMTRNDGTSYMANPNVRTPDRGFKILTDIDYVRILSGKFSFGKLPLEKVQVQTNNFDLKKFEPSVEYKGEEIYSAVFLFDENANIPKK